MKTLKAFSTTSQLNTLQITADFFQISPTQVLISFELHGAVDSIRWPTSESSPARMDQLWQHTCFECFWASATTPQAPYTEINCSPNGNWNAYSFTSYREGISPDPNIEVHLKNWESESNRAHFQIQISSAKNLSMTTVGLTAVIELLSGEKTYWSLSHPGPQPDFHNKEGWIGLLDAPSEG